jgi:DNA (cytosine-5)-methyltransferase 1
VSGTVIDWFAGIGSARLAAERAGWRCVWSCERDPAARDVYARQFGWPPDAADLLDVAPADIPAADCWVAGSPCQDLSVAGLRHGFDGTRSVLILRLLELAATVRPPWILVENVAGLLSVHRGRDFGRLLIALDDLGYDVAWRVLDARWFGVPQRRRRVFLLARRAGTAGPHPAAILLEPEGVRGGAAADGAAGEDVARPLGAGTAGGSYRDDLDHGALVMAFRTAQTSANGIGVSADAYTLDGAKAAILAPCIPAHLAKSADSDGNGLVVANTVRASDGHHGWSGGRGDGCDNLVAQTLRASDGHHGWPGGGETNLVTHTLDATRAGGCTEDGTGRGIPIVVADPIIANEGKCYSHEGSHNFRLRNVIAVIAQNGGDIQVGDGGDVGTVAASQARQTSGDLLAQPTGVRRLLPIECERLQGLPDDWTAGHADTIRYRLIGNAMAVPCVEWIFRRLRAAVEGT